MRCEMQDEDEDGNVDENGQMGWKDYDVDER